MAGSSDNPSADSFSLELSMPEAVSFVFLLTDDFACLALSKDLEYLEVTRDSSLEFAKDEGTKTVFAILGLLLSVLLVPAEAFLRPIRQNGRKAYPFLLVQEIWKASLPWL